VIVNNGTSQTFTITPNTGYQIADVKVDNVFQGAIATYTFTNVVQDHTIAASFAGVPTFTDITPVSGSTLGGTFVTITGTNLTTTTGVTFGGIAATGITVVNANTITATTPAHAAGTVTVVVTTPGGIATGTNAYTYVIPIPTFTGIMPASGSILGGTFVTITGTNLTGTTGVTFDGIAATGITVVNATTITATTPAHAAGAVTVVVTTPGGTATGTGVYTYSTSPLTGIGAITGALPRGSVLTAGALAPVGATATYQWQSSAALGGPYANIAGATATTYTTVIGDVGRYIRVRATGTGAYTGTVNSAARGPVT
jgi:hypothetical protein